MSWGRSGHFDTQEVSVLPLVEPRIVQPEAKSVKMYLDVPTVTELRGSIEI